MRACLICGSSRSRTVFREFGIDIMRCRECGHIFSSHEGSVDHDAYYRENATDWEEPFWWDEAHRAMYADFSHRFLEGRRGRLLDFGCGLGFFVRHAGLTGWDAQGVELSPEAVRYARETLGLQTVRCGMAADPPYDLVTLWDVLEHLPDPDRVLGQVRALLKPDGSLFLHTPNADVQLAKARLKSMVWREQPGVHYMEARDHLHLYTMRTLSRLLERNGFDRVEYFHLRPIQSVSGSRSELLRAVKSAWHYGAQAVFRLTGINCGNLFAIARVRQPGR